MNLLTNSLIAMVATVGFSTVAFAADEKNDASSSKMELEKLHKDAKEAAGTQATGEQDADDVITNKRLRAESGSKSRYSVSTALNYNGSTIEKPFNERRPNITSGAALDNVASISGTVAAKYNMTATDSLSLGFGLKVNTPFSQIARASQTVPDSAGQRLTAADPSVTYQKLAKMGGVQSVTILSPTYYTAKNVRADGTLGDLTLQQIFAYDFGGSKFTLGGILSASGRVFDKSAYAICGMDADSGRDILCGESQADYTLGAYPFAEYQFNDTVGLRTITGLYVYDHLRAQPSGTYFKNVIYQSVGLGISISRDVYLYPNIQFIPEDIRADRTNVALNTNINLF